MAHGLTVMLKLDDNYVIAIDEKGESFAINALPGPKPFKRSRLARAFDFVTNQHSFCDNLSLFCRTFVTDLRRQENSMYTLRYSVCAQSSKHFYE